MRTLIAAALLFALAAGQAAAECPGDADAVAAAKQAGFDTVVPRPTVASSIGVGKMTFEFVADEDDGTGMLSVAIDWPDMGADGFALTRNQVKMLASVLSGLVADGRFADGAARRVDGYQRGAFGNLGFDLDMAGSDYLQISDDGEDGVRRTVLLSPAKVAAVASALSRMAGEGPRAKAAAKAAAKTAATSASPDAGPVAAHAAELRADVGQVLFNPGGDVAVVEFFDYRCGYCKSMAPLLSEVASADRGVKVVLKELPILGRDSETAARAAIASRAQSKYPEFHAALMASRGRLGEREVMRLAGEVGLDLERLRRDMDDPAVDNEIAANRRLAAALKIDGTPGFVVGDRLAPGALSAAELRKLVAEARKGGVSL
jgi:protein-disulfide isomerase